MSALDHRRGEACIRRAIAAGGPFAAALVDLSKALAPVRANTGVGLDGLGRIIRARSHATRLAAAGTAGQRRAVNALLRAAGLEAPFRAR